MSKLQPNSVITNSLGPSIFVLYNRVSLCTVLKNQLDLKSVITKCLLTTEFVTTEFVITEFVITEFHCIPTSINNPSFFCQHLDWSLNQSWIVKEKDQNSVQKKSYCYLHHKTIFECKSSWKFTENDSAFFVSVFG